MSGGLCPKDTKVTLKLKLQISRCTWNIIFFMLVTGRTKKKCREDLQIPALENSVILSAKNKTNIDFKWQY